MKYLQTLILSTFARALLTAPAFAQTATGGVNGTVTDQHGAVVPGAASGSDPAFTREDCPECFLQKG